MSKFIFVTGGVVSGLGKGITTASLGLLLKKCGFDVDVIKFDPYLNIDPGTMSPYEHGEVYVLDDGSETDLDLGHYERFLDVNLNKNSSVTSGKIYDTILNRERNGDYLGKNVQLIPNITDYIKECFVQGLESEKDDEDKQIRLIEIGGSTGDMEGEIFLESFRQFRQERKADVLHIHLGYVPFLKCSGEYKTKPLQNSVRQLLESGLQPDIIVARYYPENNQHLSQDQLKKVALFSNVPVKNVVSLPDLDSIYSVPLYLQSSEMLSNLQNFVGKEIKPNLPSFYSQIKLLKDTQKRVKIGIIAKYPRLTDAYLSVLESLKIAAVSCGTNVETVFIDAEKLEQTNNLEEYQLEWDKMQKMDGFLVPGGFGVRGMEGKIKAINYARINKKPFLGICLGLQMAVVEFARNMCGLDAYSSEMFADREEAIKKDLLIDFMPEQLETAKKGGTMRLGGYDCTLQKDTLAFNLFKENLDENFASEKGFVVRERHRHRLEVQSQYVDELEEKGLIVSGKHYYKDKSGLEKFLVELVELPQDQHPYFIATQSHPEFLSRPDRPHPLFKGLISRAVAAFN